MIKHLLDPSFSQFGLVENIHKISDEALQYTKITDSDEMPIYCYPYSTYWNRKTGMVVLVIDDHGEQVRYYLDRAIRIHPNVRFGFYSLEPDSAVVGDTDFLHPHKPVAHANIRKTLSNISNFQIYTLFRQDAAGGLFFRGEEHSPLELVYVEKGELHNFCDGEKHTLHSKQFLIFGSKQWHMQYADEDVRFITISFSWEEHDFSPFINRAFTLSAAAQHSIHSLLLAYEQDTPYHDEYLYIQTQLLLLQILRTPTYSAQAKLPSPASELVHQRTINQAMQTVSEHVYGKLSVSDLAGLVNVSTSQLTFLFRAYLNTTPGKYITRMRLEESKTLLSEKGKSIGEVAAQLGYASIQHFSKQFHDWYGCSPSAYARQNRARLNRVPLAQDIKRL